MSMVSFLKELWRQIETDDALGLSAQCAYYFLLSLFPFLLFLMSLLGFMPVTSQDVLSLIKEYIPSGAASGMEAQLREVLDTKRGVTLSFGLLFSLVTASAAMDAIVLAVNKAYGLAARKSYIRSRLLAVALTAAMLVVVCSALLLSVFGHVIGDWMTAHTVISLGHIELWNVLRWVINFAILLLVFTGIYYVAPNTCLHCKDVIPGALIAAAGWQLTSLGFSYYVSNWGNYSSTYGSLGGVIVLMTWFYLSAFIIIVGGEINAMAYLFKKRLSLRFNRS
ncbi:MULTISPECIES: YihY/virulence factor BrkB family protein [Paenibacillus]|uniref:YihY/virulence factor BrkB family protein n=1 Tax=Paenibacillus TaxID=44249 RepID=UPI0022B8B091|nr:YihY/virulence factor BrkB family protein [Paenibacillus caseinilyticus]MCZ8521092.1 YihY/virulence factor BrkB family protein [Paenibacillus caseinilyticus]